MTMGNLAGTLRSISYLGGYPLNTRVDGSPRPCMDELNRKHEDKCDPARCPARDCSIRRRWEGRERPTEPEGPVPPLDDDDPLLEPPQPARYERSGSSRYRGVRWYEPSKKWRVMLYTPRRRIGLGYYVTEREAALAYNVAIERYGLPASMLNTIEGNGA